MKDFLKHYTTKKIKIMLVVFTTISIIFSCILIYDFINNNLPIFYILFLIPWILLSLIFKNDKTIIWDKEQEKVVKKIEIKVFFIIAWIIIIRNFFLPEIFKELNIIFVTDATLFVTLWFFIGKLFFMWSKIKCLFLENYKK